MGIQVLCYVLSALCGLATGSFLNVCIYRLPRGIFWKNQRSVCPTCGAPIRAWDNIPLLSYLILRGKCRNCHCRISPQYPIVEALNMIGWTVNFAVFGISWMTLVWDVAVSAFIVIAFVDAETMEIPDSSQIGLLILGLITFAPISGVTWQEKLIGCVCISVPLFIVAWFGGMGFGDVKLFFVLGLLFGWKKVLLIFLLSAVIGAIVSVIVIAVRRKRAAGEQTEQSDLQESADTAPCETSPQAPVSEKTSHVDEQEPDSDPKSEQEEDDEEEITDNMVPFGPFIVIAATIVMYCGDAILQGYLSLIGI